MSPLSLAPLPLVLRLLVPLLIAPLLVGPSPAADPAPRQGSDPAAVDEVRWDGPILTVSPFNGRDLTGWEPVAIPPWSLDGPRGENRWVVGVGAPDPDDPKRLTIGEAGAGDVPALITPGRGADLATEEEYGDMRVTLEYLLPKGSNAGVIPHGRYELQLLDDAHGQAKSQAEQAPDGLHKKGHLSVYQYAAPQRMPELAPGEWHALSFRFLAPRFDADGEKVSDARFEWITVDGVVVRDVAVTQGPTGRRKRGAETPTGPLMLQGDHGPVAFRNIKIETPVRLE